MGRANMLLVASLLPLAGCDQLQALVLATSVLTETADITQAKYFDPQLATTVAAFQDQAFQGLTGVLVAVAEKDNALSTTLAPLTGGQVHVSWPGAQVALCAGAASDRAGTYHAVSLDSDQALCAQPNLRYEANSEYTTHIETATNVHSLSVIAPSPVHPDAVVFSTDFTASKRDIGGATLAIHPHTTALEADWSHDPAAGDRHAFVTVLRFNLVGDPATNPAAALDANAWQVDGDNPVFDTTPRAVGELMALVSEDPQTSIIIPSDVFDTVGLYLLLLTPVELSLDVSGNLALGSGALAGKGTGFVFFVD